MALGFGFRCGFLGLLHLEITRERLEREFDLDLISTAPNVVYRVDLEDGKEHVVTNPSDWPERAEDRETPRTGRQGHDHRAERVHRRDHGAVPGAARRTCGGMDYLSETRVELRYTLPLGEIIFDFFDQLKSRTRGYASLDYEPDRRAGRRPGQGRHPAAGRAVDAFSAIVHTDKAYAYGDDDDRASCAS